MQSPEVNTLPPSQEQLKDVESNIRSIIAENAVGKEPLQGYFDPNYYTQLYLPDAPGYQTLHVSLEEDNPQGDNKKGLIARVNHFYMSRPGAADATRQSYLLRQVPDGDLLLEVPLPVNIGEDWARDKEIDSQMARRSRSIAERALEGSVYVANTIDALEEREAAQKAENQLGLHLSITHDIYKLQELLSQASPDKPADIKLLT